jgi:Na+-driven multidrug efflux pump
MMDVYFVGLSNNADLVSGVGLGNMALNLLGIQTFIGLNGALETLVPQYYGSIQKCKNKEEKDAILKQCGILL